MTTAIVCAYSSIGTAALQGLLDAGVRILRLYTYAQPSEDSWFIAPANIAKQHNIPIYHELDFNAPHVLADIKQLQPDLLCSFYFRELITTEILSIPKLGAYNLHGSLLPKYRGRAPLNWVLVNGEHETGLTLHEMTAKPDAGHIIAQQKTNIDWDDTAFSLNQKFTAISRPLVTNAITQIINNTAVRIDQSTLGTSTYFGGRKPQDGKLDFSMSVAQAFNLIRAVTDPWPGAFLQSEKSLIKIIWGLPTTTTCPPSYFKATKEGVLLGFSDGALCLHILHRTNISSSRPTEHAAWLREFGIMESS